MCGTEIAPGEDATSKGRIICQACAEVVGHKPEESEETEEIEE